MIKILKEGFPKKEYKTIFKATCPYCRCEYEFELEDCNYIEKTLNGAIQITCPFCKKQMRYYRDALETREVEIKDEK